ncbi:MAG: CHASE2 domain-containing protein [Cyanobacteria bacterium P01_C01_bin.118]
MKSWRPNWQMSLLPGLSITGLVILTRLLGLFQPLEWKVFDLSLRWRPAETTDPRVTIVTITEDDIQTALGYPISDRTLAELVQTIQAYQPRVIGIDIFRDQPVGEGFEDLTKTLTAADNVVGIHRIDSQVTVPPPPMLPEEQIGFADAILDDDGFLRRSLLGVADAEGNYRFSFTVQLARQYLAAEGIGLENGIRDPETMRFGPAEIPRFLKNTGAYIRRQDNGGNQTLINFRAGPRPFTKVSYKTLQSGQVDAGLLQDRVVLVGYTAESVKDFVSSGAIATPIPSLIPGVEVQAHAVSQILSAVIDQRPFLKTLLDGVEYLLILGTGLMGLTLAHWRRKPLGHLLIVIVVSSTGLLLGYGLVLTSWWLPMVPMVAAFLLNAAVLYPFYQAQERLRSQLYERQLLINQTYNTIHNGPLQTLTSMLSRWPIDAAAPPQMRTELQSLNQELRAVYDTMRQEMLLSTGTLVLTGQQTIDLQQPLRELLQEAYQITLERHPDFFTPIIRIISFEPMDDTQLTIDQKRDLGRFLEEAMLNVTKYAKSATRLKIECRQDNDHNIIRVVDNGKEGLMASKPTVKGGYGTKQAETLARTLGGQFQRTATDPQGVCCQLRWPIRQSPWARWLRRLGAA